MAVARASWEGSKICLLQTSVESAPLFAVLQQVFAGEGGVEAVKAAALAAGVSEDEWTAFLAFAATVYANMGNFRSFGDSKVMPSLPRVRFEAVLRASPAWAAHSETLEALWGRCGDRVFDVRPSALHLGLASEGEGSSTYLSRAVTKEDAALAQRFMDAKKILAYNTRLVRCDDAAGTLEVWVASAETDAAEPATEEFEGRAFRVRRGDFAPLLARAAAHLDQAATFAANEEQAAMLRKYAESFRSGDVGAHVDGSRHWIRDKGPAVESYIGFIETYRDPIKARAEWEGFVAVVNRAASAKLAALVDNAPALLDLLPWGRAFEKTEFLRPDFTSLDVLAFASSGVPAGINIPNYDEVRQNEGFKNVSLGNVLSARNSKDRVSFLADADQALFQSTIAHAFEVQVGLHELVGHGSGALFQENADGTFNVPLDVRTIPNPEDPSGVVQSWYKPGQTWDGTFPGLSSSYEECRAEAVGIFLTPEPTALTVFGYEPGSVEAEDIVYINWLNMARAGVMGLMFFNPTTRVWGQAHMHARFVLLQVMREASEADRAAHVAAGEADYVPFVEIVNEHLLTLENVESKAVVEGESATGVFVRLRRDKIRSVGVPAVGAFLRKLQIFKSTADYARGKAMFDAYSAVSPTMLALRALVMANRPKRPAFVQPEIVADGADGPVRLQTFAPTAEGMIASFVARFSATDDDLLRLADTDLRVFG